MQVNDMVCSEETAHVGTCNGEVQSIFVVNRISTIPCIFIYEEPEVLGYAPMNLLAYNQPLRIEHKLGR